MINLDGPADNDPQTSPRPSTRRRLVLVPLAALLALCGAVSAVSAWIGQTLLTGTVQAGKGAPCPACAIDVYIRTGPINPWGGDDLSVAHVMCAQRRTQLRQQLRDFATTYRQAAAAKGIAARLETGTTVSGNHPDDRADGHTWVVMRINNIHDSMNGQPQSSSTHLWRFEVIEQDGWRICTAELPPVCGNLITCNPPTPTTRSRQPTTPPARAGAA